MTDPRSYPERPVDAFAPPPRSFRDKRGRRIDLERVAVAGERAVDRLVEMYRDFDPADRAQGLPPIQEPAIRAWLGLVLDAGPDVVAIHDGQVVGHATLVRDDDGAYELAIFVHQDYQGNGIGSEVLRALLGAGKAEGLERVWLTVERWNAAAIALYEAVGFEACGRGRFELEMSIRLA